MNYTQHRLDQSLYNRFENIDEFKNQLQKADKQNEIHKSIKEMEEKGYVFNFPTVLAINKVEIVQGVLTLTMLGKAFCAT